MDANRHLQMVRVRNGRDAMACCCAIVAGIEYHELEITAERLGIGLSDWDFAFAEKVLTWHRVNTTETYHPYPGLFGGIHIVEVADLNVKGWLTYVVLDARHKDSEVIVLDPHRGLRDRDYYGIHPVSPADQRGVNPQLHNLNSYGRGLYCERLGEAINGT